MKIIKQMIIKQRWYSDNDNNNNKKNNLHTG